MKNFSAGSGKQGIRMDDVDRRILDELQNDFPLAADPYAVMAERLGLDAAVLWERVRELVAAGVIRRLGFSIDSRRIGYTSTLAAVKVEPDDVERAAALMRTLPQITHCYLRDDAYNIWFTVIAENADRVAEVLEQVRAALGLGAAAVMNLPAEKLFKLDTRFTAR